MSELLQVPIHIVRINFKSGGSITVPVSWMEFEQNTDQTGYKVAKWRLAPHAMYLKIKRSVGDSAQYSDLGYLQSVNVNQIEAVSIIDTVRSL